MEEKIVLRQDVDTAISKKVDPVELAQNIYPRIEHALQLASTPAETNEIRNQIGIVNTYIRHSLPKYVKDRLLRFEYSHEGEML